MKVTALYVYPIKGLRGIKLKTAPIGPQGVRHDRTFMLFHHDPSTQTTRKLQLSSHPECSLFSQSIVFDPSAPLCTSSATLTVRYRVPSPPLLPHHPSHDQPLHIPLNPDWRALSPFPVDLYGSAATGYRMGDPYDAWFSACFGLPVILVYIGDARRPILGTSAPSARLPPPSLLATATRHIASLFSLSRPPAPAPPAEWITWADMAPLLVTSQASLADVQARLPARISMARFRPNIVVDGAGTPAWDEDFWARLQIGGSCAAAQLALTANCVRCTSLNVDARTGRVGDGEMGQVLRKLMKDRRVDAGNKYAPVFGRYAFLVDGDGGRDEEGALCEVEVSLGDEVTVAERNEKRDVWDWPSERERAQAKKAAVS
ncbi:hypothetical protein TD95_002266 [Thielaviopsis punctulata]|uniref:MOSC domain-containing protein n=1 Tax=Thielaviopsis punctulata TaxID=72032 RepID=A0A0F4ZIH9_9PEZI|nr:hypothetical protein TD95_002266 [Thielaviopsis punctulata]